MKDKTIFITATAFIAGITLTHVIETWLNQKSLITMEINQREKENRIHHKSFTAGWDGGAAAARSDAMMEKLRTQKDQPDS